MTIMPVYNLHRNKCIRFGAELFHGYQECGHKAVCVRIRLVWWTLNLGIEFNT